MQPSAWLLGFALFFFGAAASAKTLTVYVYDAFTGPGGIGDVVKREFEKKTQSSVVYRHFGGAADAFNQVVMEGPRTTADLLVGVDTSLLPRTRPYRLFEKLDPAFLANVPAELRFDRAGEIAPFDYGYLAFVYDAHRHRERQPTSLYEMMTSAALHKHVILPDPRTSSLGLCFLLWVNSAFPGGAYTLFWKNFTRQVRALPAGWSAAYALFRRSPGDYTLSYTTTPAYHLERERRTQVTALIFPKGHLRQIEGAGILKSAKEKELAKVFLETLLSETVQAQIPTTQWMYPVRPGVKLPASFAGLPKVPVVLDPPADYGDGLESSLLEKWALAMSAN